MNSNWMTPTRATNEETKQHTDGFTELTPHNVTVYQTSSVTSSSAKLSKNNEPSWNNSYRQNNSLSSPIAHRQDLGLAKDEIIEQKDVMLQKQKMIIIQLRQTNSELEELLIQSQRDQYSCNNERMDMRIREYQYQVSQLQQKIHEEKLSRQNEIDKLNHQLGEKEYEYGQLAIMMKEGQISYNSQIDRLNKQLDGQLEKFKEVEESNRSMSNNLKQAKKENKKLQSYLEDLPTNEEFQLIKSEVKRLNQEKDEIETEKKTIYMKYKETYSNLQIKVAEHKELLKDYSELKGELFRISETLNKYKLQDELGPITLADFENIKEELKNIQKKKQDLKVSLEKRNKKLNSLHYELLEKEKDYKLELDKQREITADIQEQLVTRNASVITLNAVIQKLHDANNQLQSKVEKFQQIYNEEYKSAMNDYMKESDGCITDMSTFINLCKSTLNGKDPSIHVLLGLNDSPEKDTAPSSFNNDLIDTQTLVKKKTSIADIRHDIDDLRHSLSEKYAQKISEDMCITQ